MDRSEKTIISILVILLLIACCLLVMCGAIFYFTTGTLGLFSPEAGHSQDSTIPIYPAPTQVLPQPSPTFQGDAGQGEGSLAAFEELSETLITLQNTEIPNADLVYLAERYMDHNNIPLKLNDVPTNYLIGDRLDFYKLNVDTNTTERITAVLRYASDQVYFWTEEGLNLDNEEINRVMLKFETDIYPTNQEFFGKEWIPGVDNDPHLYILYAGNMGGQLAGYTASTDGVVPQAHEFSNAHEMFYVNADVQWLSDPYTLSVMAHELQHLIHGYHDPNEELWMNEGFSELATLLNGYSAGGFDSLFASNTDVQLNDWSVESSYNSYHYGASFLFVTYLLERFGEDFTKALVADKLGGFDSIDQVLSDFGYKDQKTGEEISANDVFMDWTITNYVNDADFDDGRYTYNIYDDAPSASATETLTDCQNIRIERTVHQYGTDYIRLACGSGDIELHFSGEDTVSVLPVATGDSYFMWSNRADASVTTLSREFDFTKVADPITMTYNTWFDLEPDYDFLYLVATEENGTDRIINTPSCSISDTTGNSFGCGYNGSSNGWISESVDLSDYAGKIVTLSFEYVTDEAVTAEGFILDDIRVSEIDYITDFETDDGGWKGEGFVRINNLLPQTFLVSIIDTYNNLVVDKFTLSNGEDLNIVLSSLPKGYDYVLAVSGSSRYTRQEAGYLIDLR